tara:strand:- start:284 stop:736 length:453 start_codon:yes stop_codon:yes gene_type:complete
MRVSNFIDEFNINEDEEEFLHSRIVEQDLKAAGWKIKEVITPSVYHQKFKDLKVTITNPNFYNDGHIIAESRKSVIMASGYPIIKLDGKEYSSVGNLLRPNALDILKRNKEWEWIQVADWIIVTKKDNILLGQFNDWSNLPNRKDVENNE